MKRLIGTWQEKAALKLKRPWQAALPRFSSRAGAWHGALGAALAAPEHSECLARLAGSANP